MILYKGEISQNIMRLVSKITNEEILKIIKDKLGDIIINNFEYNELLSIDIIGKNIHTVAKFLKENNELSFNMLSDISGADYSTHSETHKERFAAIYIFYSINNNVRIKVRAFVPENNLNIPTITDLFMGADWPEREIYDMFGVIFDNHPKLERLLMPDYYEYNPLRKDYPLKGKGERTNFPTYNKYGENK